MTKIHPKHPNCPICSKRILNKGYLPNPYFEITKLYRLYIRKGTKFIAHAWYCKTCNFIIFDNHFKNKYQKRLIGLKRLSRKLKENGI